MDTNTSLSSSGLSKGISFAGLRVSWHALCLCLGALALYAPLYPVLYRQFTARDSYYSHGFLIPFISLFLVWRRRRILYATALKPAWPGLFVLVGGVAMYLASRVVKMNAASYASVFVTIAGLLWYTGGLQLLKILLFPLGFLAFMFPLPEVVLISISFKLKMFAAYAAVFAAQKMSFAVTQAGSTIYFPGGSLLVGDPCSGMRSLISFLALGAVCTQFCDASFVRRWGVFVCAVPIALFSNALRLLFLIGMGYIYGQEYTSGFWHDASGIMVFVVALAAFMGAAKLLRCSINADTILSH